MIEQFQHENPFWAWMGFKIDEDAAAVGQAVVRVRIRSEFLQHQRLIHGGVMSALIDSCGAWAFALRHRESLRTINLAVQYLDPTPRDAEELVAQGVLVRAGRRIVVTDVTVSAGHDQMVARGQVLYSRASKPRV
jgi:uncharacterized protein (TIGR00369 family)